VTQGGAEENAKEKAEQAQGNNESIQTDFAHTDHTDLYTVRLPAAHLVYGGRGERGGLRCA
jgi:hypothetical protein